MKTVLDALGDPLGLKASRGIPRPNVGPRTSATTCTYDDLESRRKSSDGSSKSGLKGIIRDAWDTEGSGHDVVHTQRHSMSSLEERKIGRRVEDVSKESCNQRAFQAGALRDQSVMESCSATMVTHHLSIELFLT
jgi:hypothetical protein